MRLVDSFRRVVYGRDWRRYGYGTLLRVDPDPIETYPELCPLCRLPMFNFSGGIGARIIVNGQWRHLKCHEAEIDLEEKQRQGWKRWTPEKELWENSYQP